MGLEALSSADAGSQCDPAPYSWRRRSFGLNRVSLKGTCIYLVRGVCVPDIELGSEDTAVNKRGPALLGMTFQFCRTDPDRRSECN